jgi:hypothetical protein
MPKGNTAAYYAANPKARRVRLKQQKLYDNGPKRNKILSYHRELGAFRSRNKKRLSTAKKKNGGKAVDVIHSKGRIIGFGDRSRNRAEPRTR